MQRSTLLLKFDGPPGTSTGVRCGRVTIVGPDKGWGSIGPVTTAGGAGAPPSCGGGVNGDGTEGATPGNWLDCARAVQVAQVESRSTTAM
jgi:hypothetical protein